MGFNSGLKGLNDKTEGMNEAENGIVGEERK
jgi:hypothetical protein